MRERIKMRGRGVRETSTHTHTQPMIKSWDHIISIRVSVELQSL